MSGVAGRTVRKTEAFGFEARLTVYFFLCLVQLFVFERFVQNEPRACAWLGDISISISCCLWRLTAAPFCHPRCVSPLWLATHCAMWYFNFFLNMKLFSKCQYFSTSVCLDIAFPFQTGMSTVSPHLHLSCLWLCCCRAQRVHCSGPQCCLYPSFHSTFHF